MSLPGAQPDPVRGTPGAYDCPTCIHGQPPVLAPKSRRVRLGMHCGFLPREEWRPGRDGLPVMMGGEPYTEDACPGWLVRQPEVNDAAEAFEALEAGILQRFDPRGSRVVTLAALLMRRVMNRRPRPGERNG